MITKREYTNTSSVGTVNELTFGKYKGRNAYDLLGEDDGCIQWLMGSDLISSKLKNHSDTSVSYNTGLTTAFSETSVAYAHWIRQPSVC